VSDYLKVLLPALIPLASGLVGAFLGAVVVTSRGLRRDLAVDVQMLALLPVKARALLQQEVTRRTFRLVAAGRFPHLVLLDLFTFAGCVAAIMFLAEGFREFAVGLIGPDILIIQCGFGISVTVGLWAAFHFSWTNRAAGRVEFIREHLGVDAASESAKVNRVFVVPSMLLGVVASFGLLAAAAAAVVHQYEWPELVLILALAALMMGAMMAAFHVHAESDLGKIIDGLLHAANREREVKAIVEATATREAKRQLKQEQRRAKRQLKSHHGG
jgi:hypothetical protein